jgi:hypothetical protein
MAVTNMNPVKGNLNKITPFAFEAASSAADGFAFKLPRATDEYVIVLVQNTGSGAGTFTVKKPTRGSYFASASDETHSLAAGEFAIFRFESAKWANNDGTILCVPGATTVKAVVLY